MYMLPSWLPRKAGNGTFTLYEQDIRGYRLRPTIIKGNKKAYPINGRWYKVIGQADNVQAWILELMDPKDYPRELLPPEQMEHLGIRTKNPAVVAAAIAKDMGVSYWEAMGQAGYVTRDHTAQERLFNHKRRMSQKWYRDQQKAQQEQGGITHE